MDLSRLWIFKKKRLVFWGEHKDTFSIHENDSRIVLIMESSMSSTRPSFPLLILSIIIVFPISRIFCILEAFSNNAFLAFESIN